MVTRQLDIRPGAVLVAGFAAFASLPAAAAPQVLALIATDQPVPLHCAGAVCTASLPTVCVQPERRAPEVGRAYRLADGQSVSVEDGGRVVTLSGAVRLVARRTHVAVEIRIPRERIAGLARPAIRIGEGVSAVPLPVAADRRPQAAAEVAEATGARRAVATAIVDRDPLRAPAVRMTNRLANGLAAGGDAKTLWPEILADARAHAVPAKAVAFARTMREICDFKVGAGTVPSLGACLAGLHDEAMEYLNVDLERALKAGS